MEVDPRPAGGALLAAPAASRALPAAELRGLCRRFGEVLANDGIDLDLGHGEIVGLLGPNGAGKTTLVRQLVGLLRPDAGSIRLLGRDLRAERAVAPRVVGYLAQREVALLDLPVTTAVETSGRLRGLPRRRARAATAEIVEELGLGPLAHRVIGTLSGGQRRLAAFATTLVGERPVLVLDEPTTGLDPVARRAVWGALARRRAELGTAVLLVTHNVLEAETVVDRVALLDGGRLVACDTPGRLKALVSDDVRLDLVWRGEPPLDDPLVAGLAHRAVVEGPRWRLRMPVGEARQALAELTVGAAFGCLDDFTLATPTLEDVYLALGGRAVDMERG